MRNAGILNFKGAIMCHPLYAAIKGKESVNGLLERAVTEK